MPSPGTGMGQSTGAKMPADASAKEHRILVRRRGQVFLSIYHRGIVGGDSRWLLAGVSPSCAAWKSGLGSPAESPPRRRGRRVVDEKGSFRQHRRRARGAAGGLAPSPLSPVGSAVLLAALGLLSGGVGEDVEVGPGDGPSTAPGRRIRSPLPPSPPGRRSSVAAVVINRPCPHRRRPFPGTRGAGAVQA
jgi:hypothetical protein